MDPEVEFIDKRLRELSEHWECVQILVSRLNPKGETEMITRGGGNYYARRAMCQTFVERDQADTLSRANNPPPDDAESWKT